MTYELLVFHRARSTRQDLATTLDYPAVMDTVGCTPDFLEKNPEAAKALADSYFEALQMRIKPDKAKSGEIMGKDVKQSGEDFGKSRQTICAGRTRQPTSSLQGEFKEFSTEAADLLLKAGVIKSKPNLDDIVDKVYRNITSHTSLTTRSGLHFARRVRRMRDGTGKIYAALQPIAARTDITGDGLSFSSLCSGV